MLDKFDEITAKLDIKEVQIKGNGKGQYDNETYEGNGTKYVIEINWERSITKAVWWARLTLERLDKLTNKRLDMFETYKKHKEFLYEAMANDIENWNFEQHPERNEPRENGETEFQTIIREAKQERTLHRALKYQEKRKATKNLSASST